MINQDFELLGHDNPLGRYPAPVVPVGFLGNRLVAIYASEKEPDIVKLEDGVLFVRYDDSTKKALGDFRFLDHRLFAFSETDVAAYSIRFERRFFRELLNNPIIRKEDPFFRLSLAKGTGSSDFVVPEIVLCLKTLVKEESSESPFIDAWYETQRADLSRLATDLPTNWRLLLEANRAPKVHRPSQTLSFRSSTAYRDDVSSRHYQRDYERNFFRGGATTGAVAAKKRMTQSDVINYFVERTGMKRAQVKRLFEELANLATSEVKTAGEFVLPGFGKLVRSERKAREGRNPTTGETIEIPAKTTLKFRVGKAMKDSVLPRK